MRLNSLHMVNFRQHADSRLAFDSGLTGIIGPNGAGKTTILEAIAWALYGNSAARGTKESIRYARAAPGARVRVELVFELAGHRYRVVRGLSTAELYLDGGGAPIANSITGVTELLQRRLGMSKDEFFHTYFTGQKELNVMAAMKPAERAKFLSRVLGYERLRTAQDLARERRKTLLAEITGMKGVMPDRQAVARALALAETRLTDAEARAKAVATFLLRSREALDAVKPQWDRAQREREQWSDLSTRMRLAQGDVERLDRDRERIARELAEVGAARKELETLRKELAGYAVAVDELHRLDGLNREEGRRQALVDQDRTLAGDLKQLAQRVEALASAPVTVVEVERDLSARRLELDDVTSRAEARRSEWVSEKSESQTKRQALRDQLKDVRRQKEVLHAAGEDGQCPTCARPLGDGHFAQVMELLEEQENTITVNGNFYRRRLEQLEPEPAALVELDQQRKKLTTDATVLERKLAKAQSGVKELEGLQKEVADRTARRTKVAQELAAIPVGYDGARHAAVRAEVERLTPLDQRAARRSGAVERLPIVELERDQIEAARVVAVTLFEDLVARNHVLAFDAQRHAAIRGEWEQAETRVRAAELDDVKVRAEVDGARSSVESAATARKELEKIQARLDGLHGDRRLHDEVDRAYTELRDELNEQLRPEVSEIASTFLTDLTDGRYTELELNDDYDIVLLEDGVPKPVISGGEDDIANLVLRLAVSQMIAERAGQSFSLLVLDEVFGSLDDSHRHNVVELLRRLHDRFDQVILITHIESVRDGLDRVITVRYDQDRASSVIEGASGEDAASDEELLPFAVAG